MQSSKPLICGREGRSQTLIFTRFNVNWGSPVISIRCKEIEKMWYGVAIQEKKIIAATFSPSGERVLRSLLESLPYDTPFQTAKKSSGFSTKVLEAMKAIFDGKDVRVNRNLDMDHLPSYTRRVLRCVSLIPVGYVTAYGAIAKVVGGSPRAVGQALALNPFLLLIPCHRVVRADLSTGGFSGHGGAKTKRELLMREDRGYGKKTKIEACGKILALFPIKHLRDINP